MANSLMRWVLSIAGGLPLAIVAIGLVMIWVEPQSVANGRWVKLGASLVMIEFLLLHSGAFMSVGPAICKKPWQNLLWFLGMTMFYLVFFVGVAWWIEEKEVVWVLAGVLLGRLLTLVILRDKRGTILMLQRSAIGIVLLILTMMLCLIPWPDLGITEAVRYQAFGPAEDSLSEHPERFLVWGIAYFSINAALEFYVGWRLPDWTDEEVEKGWKVFTT